MTKLLSEKELIEQLRKGNAIAFDQLFTLYGGKLFGFALKYLKTESEAEELVQEVFVRVWEHRANLKKEHTLKPYLFTIALNQIRKYFNKKANALKFIARQEFSPAIDNQTEESIDYASVLRCIDEVIAQFPDRKRLIFRKSRVEGKTSKEIAKELNISTGTVDNQISEALKIIRKELGKEDLSLLLFMALFL